LTPVEDLFQSIGIPARNRSSLNWPYFYESEAYRCTKKASGAGLALLKPCRQLVAMLVVLTIAGNELTLVVPKLIERHRHTYTHRTCPLHGRPAILRRRVPGVRFELSAEHYADLHLERVARTCARDWPPRLRPSPTAASSGSPRQAPDQLTSDVDGVKLFVSMAVATIIASVFLIIGASVMLLTINWRLG
jgi:ATP-binding cassette subfamily B protein